MTAVTGRLVDLGGKKLETEKELDAVKLMAGANVQGDLRSAFATCLQEELALQGLQQQQVCIIMQATMQRMQFEPGQQVPAAVAAHAAPQQQQPDAAAVHAAATKERQATVAAA